MFHTIDIRTLRRDCDIHRDGRRFFVLDGVAEDVVEKLRAERNDDDVRRALEAITKAAESRENGNLLACAVEAARVRCSLGEISDAVEKVSGRYQAVIHTISGVYSSEFTDKTALDKARHMADEFEELTGRRPRIFVAKMGQDGHDRGQKVIASSFADMGWDVDVGPLFQTPEETAQDAVDNDVHMVGFSSLAAVHWHRRPLSPRPSRHCFGRVSL